MPFLHEIALTYISVAIFFFFFLFSDDFDDYLETKAKFDMKLGKIPQYSGDELRTMVLLTKLLYSVGWMPYVIYLMFRSL